MTQDQIATKEDLKQLEDSLLKSMANLLLEQKPANKKWLKSKQVKEILGISDGTLQNLRINGTLNPTKVGGSYYYDLEGLMQVFENNKIDFNHKQNK
ncbi:MAG: helix-turn-helix domain-containing protein [Bacteroidetes bacterium]|nr:helix-turn-helix domain-containing protein [Bacteroidota bacterium]